VASADQAPSPLAAVEARQDELLPRLTAPAGAASLCMISRSSGPVDGAEYLEGRVAYRAGGVDELVGLLG